MFSTAELHDRHGTDLQIVAPGFRHFGRDKRFHGEMVTLKVDHDFLLIKQTLGQPGHQKVLVIDGGGSRRCALLGDRLATMAIDNNWAGILVNGCIRDSAVIRELEIGVIALGTCPARPAMEGGGEANVVLQFAEAEFKPGEFLYTDEDGILLSPAKLELP